MTTRLANIFLYHNASRRRKTRHLLVRKEDVESRVQDQEEEEDEAPPPSPQELQYVRDIERVLELLRKNRDMLFSEGKHGTHYPLTLVTCCPRPHFARFLLFL
uniref:Uncharacterized protein n=1 Tax=Populus davidiana TaxID=266767 RepID=A0A6M2ERS7_9ROSI